MNTALARRFPLIARPRPACTPMPQQIASVKAAASEAALNGDVGAASAVFNLAALLASDCGMPGLARQWCRQLAKATLTNCRDGRYALEPVVNIARLHIRAGDGLQAWTLLEKLLQAATDRASITIDGIDIPVADLTRP